MSSMVLKSKFWKEVMNIFREVEGFFLKDIITGNIFDGELILLVEFMKRL